MRKNSSRKWLHAILDLLPVIFIPVFMIYSHRHQINNYDITYSVAEKVDLYQGVVNGKPYNTNGWENIGPTTMTFTNNGMNFFAHDEAWEVSININLNVKTNDYIYFKMSFDLNDSDISGPYDFGGLLLFNNDFEFYLQEDNNMLIPEYNIIKQYTGTETTFTGINMYQYNENWYINFNLKNVQIFNLTSIYGAGNEPTLEEFNNFLNGNYYNFGNNVVLTGNFVDVVYNNTDIGSQFVYAMYQPIHDYFNFNNLSVFNGIYNWIQLNMFGGTAPVSVFIVWQIIVYEFLVDLLFIFYSFFMFLIDFCEYLLEKPFNKINRGK